LGFHLVAFGSANREIVTRHIGTFLLQNYRPRSLSQIDPSQPRNFFLVLGASVGIPGELIEEDPSVLLSERKDNCLRKTDAIRSLAGGVTADESIDAGD
jgi:hypothetical protein